MWSVCVSFVARNVEIWEFFASGSTTWKDRVDSEATWFDFDFKFGSAVKFYPRTVFVSLFEHFMASGERICDRNTVFAFWRKDSVAQG